LTLSAAGFVSVVMHEGYTDRAVIPVPGDVPTIGFGTTTNPDGSPVRMGDTTTPPKALDRALRDVRKFEGAIKGCVKVPLAQHEYDFAVSFSYNVGAFAFCNSTVVKRWNAEDYAGGCEAVMMWTYVGRKDCRDRANNCYGLVVRREAERKQCLGLN
jgi:lysozyme